LHSFLFLHLSPSFFFIARKSLKEGFYSCCFSANAANMTFSSAGDKIFPKAAYPLSARRTFPISFADFLSYMRFPLRHLNVLLTNTA